MHLFAKISPAKPRPVLSQQPALRLSLLALSLMAALGQCLAPAHAAEPRLALAASASPAPTLRSARLLGRLEAGTALRVGLILPLRNQNQLSDLLARQYTPGDALYHQFLTPPEFAARFGPTAQDYDAVAAYARAQGLTITGTTPGRTLLNVSGPSARIEAAFGLQMNRYRLPDGRAVFANSTAPLLPRSIAARLAGIAGLNNVAVMRPHLSRMTAHPLFGSGQAGSAQGALHSNAPAPITGTGGGIGSGALGGLTPNDIKYAYGLSGITTLYGSTVAAPTATLNGAGQNIGLFELDGFVVGDINTYVATFGLPTVTTSSLNTVLLGGFSGTPLSVSGEAEVTLDIDMVLALAPASSVYVYEENPTTDASAPLTIFTRMANALASGSSKPLLQIICCCWGIAEQDETPAILQGENTLFQQMAAQGQSVICASGDNGAYDLYTPTPTATTVVTAPAVDNPASQPYATGVGGTTLSYVKPGTNATTGAVIPGAYAGEKAWSAGTATTNPEGGGGGASSIWPKPTYQLGAGASPTRRDVPDVSLNADPNSGYVIYTPAAAPATPPVAGVATVVGGTSAAAPLWAAYTALVNQQRTANGLGSIGFLNPQIYPIAAGTSYTADFHDVISGSNLFYQAGVGFDDATGYGSFNGAPLLAALSPSVSQGAGTATLTGTVTDAAAVPVAGATITVSVASTGAAAGATTTDSTGLYTLTVPAGLVLKVTVGTASVTAPKTESLTGQIVTVPALTASLSVTQNFSLTASFVYAAGLQMISAPFDYSGLGDFATLFGLTKAQASLSPRLIKFAPLTNSYVFYPAAPADTLRLGQGYWVRFPTTEFLHITGTAAPVTQAYSITLQQGWNQIGDPFTLAAPLSTVTVIKSDSTMEGTLAASKVVQPTLYRFDTTSNAYVALAPATDSLTPYLGYWVFAFQPSTLSIPAPGPPAAPVP